MENKVMAVKLTNRVTKNIPCLSRQDTVLAMHLRSGHIPLNKFAFLMGKIATPKCLQCGSVEDVFHILMECVRNESQRQNYFTNNPIFLTTGGLNIVLSNPSSNVARLIYKLAKTVTNASNTNNTTV